MSEHKKIVERVEAQRKKALKKAQKDQFTKIDIKPSKPKRTTKARPIKKIKKVQKKLKKKPVKRITKDKIITAGDIISPRGRQSFAQQAALGQPQSAQDYFTSSTAIAAVSYNQTKQTLTIQFVSGGVYEYFNVEELHFRAFTSPYVASKGRYFWANIRGQYNFRRIT